MWRPSRGRASAASERCGSAGSRHAAAGGPSGAGRGPRRPGSSGVRTPPGATLGSGLCGRRRPSPRDVGAGGPARRLHGTLTHEPESLTHIMACMIALHSAGRSPGCIRCWRRECRSCRNSPREGVVAPGGVGCLDAVNDSPRAPGFLDPENDRAEHFPRHLVDGHCPKAATIGHHEGVDPCPEARRVGLGRAAPKVPTRCLRSSQGGSAASNGG